MANPVHYHTCVVIPIKNPDQLLVECICSVGGQQYKHDTCLLLVSSGHDKRLLDTVMHDYADRVHMYLRNISPNEFQHGRTRNLAAKYIDADFYVFLTQDAIPANSDWLANLVHPLIENKNVAGSYSRHIAHKGHSIFVKAELKSFFEDLAHYPLVNKLMLGRAGSLRERDLMRFFSNNSSCVRGSLLKAQFPFPEVDFAEDQAWSANVLKSSYAKAFCYDSIIYHSHNMTLSESFGRGLDEAKSFRENHSRRLLGINPFGILAKSMAFFYLDVKCLPSFNSLNRRSLAADLCKQLLTRTSLSLGSYVGSSARLTKFFASFSRDKRIQESRQ